MLFWMLLMLALATSLDSLGVGVAYGLSMTRVRAQAHACISVVMFTITWASVALGNQLAHILPDTAGKVLSALLFVGLGLWILAPLLRRTAPPSSCLSEPSDRSPGLNDVLNDPQLADRDNSREIDPREALLLGAALSLNNVGGGISAGLIHIDAIVMAGLSVLFNLLLLVGGHVAGMRLSRCRFSAATQGISGLLLVVIGLWQFR